LASKSAKQQALQRSRQEAIAAGTLNEWYAKRGAERLAAEKLQAAARNATIELRPAPVDVTIESTPAPTVSQLLWDDTPYTPSPEFQHAYSGPSVPEAAVWDERGIMHWCLPVHTITHIPRRAYTPRVTPNL
jgi:hypothetical protein